VAAQLARTRVRTVYGNVSFDVNRQNSAPFTTLQVRTLALVPGL
jgi:hypothetical protein